MEKRTGNKIKENLCKGRRLHNFDSNRFIGGLKDMNKYILLVGGVVGGISGVFVTSDIHPLYYILAGIIWAVCITLFVTSICKGVKTLSKKCLK